MIMCLAADMMTDTWTRAGRNEVGQLGVGFNSQEGTRNLVQGFEGEGILQSAASLQSSYLLVKKDQGEDIPRSLYQGG